MALPPEGDPLRPLHIAARLSYALAVVLILDGAWSIHNTWVSVDHIPVGRRVPFTATASLSIFGPGVAYIVFANYLRRQRYWAIIASLVLTSLQFLPALQSLAFALLLRQIPKIQPQGLTAFLGIWLLILLMGTLTYYLMKSFPAVDGPDDKARGFDPVLPIDEATELQQIP